MNNQSVTLYYREGSSDKVYQATLEEKDGGFVVNGCSGCRLPAERGRTGAAAATTPAASEKAAPRARRYYCMGPPPVTAGDDEFAYCFNFVISNKFVAWPPRKPSKRSIWPVTGQSEVKSAVSNRIR